ncbi:MAG TPA: hypothetical protein VF316_07620 [Polyangiaceae bacterium]
MRRALLATALAVTALSCGGSKTFDGSVYRGGELAFRVGPIPSSWHRLDRNDAPLVFRDEAAQATVLVNGRCPGDDAPLLALTAHLLIGTTERDIRSEETVPFDGREARHTIVTAKLDGVAKTLDLYVLKKDKCVYDFVYITAPDRYEAAGPAFQTFVTGFHTLPASGKEGP